MLLCLFDDELDAIMNACRPLAVDQRDAFLREVAARCLYAARLALALTRGPLPG